MSQGYTVCPRCGRRAGDFVDTCPNCGWEYHPRPRRSRRGRVLFVVIALVLTVCLGWVIFRALSTGAVQRALGLESTPMPSLTPLIVYVIATSPPPTPTIPPTITLTPIPLLSPSPLRTGAATPRFALATLTPATIRYPAPTPVEPIDRARFTGKDASIILVWKPVVASLSENEWYRILVAFTGRDGKPVERIGWAKESQWEMVPDWWSEISTSARTVAWNVTVVHVDNVDPFASPTFAVISGRSISCTFTWE